MEITCKNGQSLFSLSAWKRPINCQKYPFSVLIWISTYYVMFHFLIYNKNHAIGLRICNPFYRLYSWVGYYTIAVNYEKEESKLEINRIR